MRFSLVVATLGRTTELRRLFESLQRQSHRDFEVIVIDQNADDRLSTLVASFSNHFEIQHLRAAPGLSRARNIGLHGITGEIICFPDDDCWYPDELLVHVNREMAEHPEWAGVIGDSVDESGRPTLPWPDREGRLSPPMSWRRAVTYVYFLRRGVLEQVGGFDETLGPGSGTPWGCGEDNDLMLRVLEGGHSVHFDPALRVHHPRMFPTFDEVGREKRYRYALGDGHLLRKHPMPPWWVVLFFAVPACRIVWAAARFKGDEASCHWAALKGRMKGFSESNAIRTRPSSSSGRAESHKKDSATR